VGIRNAILNFRQQEENHIMENVIYNELRIRGYQVDVGIVECRTTREGKSERRQYEVDFVANKGDQRYYIQSAFSIPDEEKMRQETASFRGIKDSFKRVVVVKDHITPYRNEQGYFFVGLFDFLLNPDILIKG
jgi:hypothetical protein